MSLKEVQDDATAELMSRFYRHWIGDKCSKRQALVEAQRELREEGFTDSSDWATFILLDALD